MEVIFKIICETRRIGLIPNSVSQSKEVLSFSEATVTIMVSN